MLKIENLHVSIEEKPLLKGINLHINAGEVHAIMGPNGSGKSTLSSVIAGKKEYKVTTGIIRFEGEKIIHLSPEERAQRGIFLSFQDPIEIPGVSVTNFIRTSVNSLRKARGLEDMPIHDMLKTIRKKLEIFGMDKNFLSRSLNEGFSGGEKKRNEIFQMAMLNPKLSILDETDSGLDIDALRTVSQGINAFKSKKNAILIITHYYRILKYIVPDFVHVLYRGKMVKSGGKKLALDIEKNGYSWIKPV
ncbi:FeS assembly ATPase SufC [Candidatus Uzinura diaspidicola str. ASNER]|uniref:FeS assembly ATPase SufC n=1 Tax=Candidatus Uzinura diaspidicola str. ASNER TaxID=1133592 RepID=L7VFZ1_9FLAO|nr:FeS assembly ATPase SufC [Candidatus Uzinura diaspidicola str. ASNER]